jgi:ABC-type antimicrobial peptide transport system permease subunit
MRNTIQLAFRNFRKHKFFTLIHISGLAIGISAALVIYLVVQHEYSYEKGLKDRDRIYRVVSTMVFPDMTIHNSGVPAPTAAALRTDGTGIQAVAQLMTTGTMKVSVPQAGIATPVVFRKQANVTYADQYYFQVVPYTWLAGAGPEVLKEPYRVVLSEARFRQYFGSVSYADALGKTLCYNDSIQAVLTGVVAMPGYNTDFHFQEFISMATIPATRLKNNFNWEEWGSISSNSQLLVKLEPGTQAKAVEKQLVAIREKYRTKDPENPKDDVTHAIQGVSDIHFNGEYDAFEQRQADNKVLVGLLAVAAFLLLLGCINFINLSTAQSGLRAKEIGIRKTLGSSKKQIMQQFLGETAILTIIALLFSVCITPGILKVFKDFIPPGIQFSSLNQPHVWIFLAGLVLLVTLLAGFYPALVLTQFKPVTVMKNQAAPGSAGSRKSWLRKTLTVAQFVIAQFLIIATLVLGQQIRYSLNKDLGYNRDAIVFVELPWNFFATEKDTRKFALVDKLRKMPELKQVALAGSPPAAFGYSTSTMEYVRDEKKLETMVEQKTGDSSYFRLYGLQIVAGRMPFPSDTTREWVMNEAYVKFLGFTRPQDVLGISIHDKPVVGVVRDFHPHSTRAEIKPLVYAAQTDFSFTLHLGLQPRGTDPDAWSKTLKKVEAAYKEVYPDSDFSYNFFDESISRFYTAEQNLSRLLKWASGLCVFISCLGLLGLVMFTTHTRMKEIGVRKVLGASVMQIISLLSRDFVVLVLVAFALAAPAAWWFMREWLNDFAYRTSISWWIFLACGAGMLLLALSILSIRTIRAAMDNPVGALRTE